MATGDYLGDSKVVERLVGQFINTVANASSVNEIHSIIYKYRDIFMGLSNDYIAVDGWNNERNLGSVLARRLSISDQGAWGELFKDAFAELACFVLTIKKESSGKSDKELEAEVLILKKYMAAILLGVFDNLYPDTTWSDIFKIEKEKLATKSGG